MTQFTPYLIILPLFTLFLRFHTAAALPADRQNVPHHLQTRKISRLEEPEIDNAMRYVNPSVREKNYCPGLAVRQCQKCKKLNVPIVPFLESCKRTDYIHVLRVDGDGHGIPEFYVGYSPMTGEVIIAHAGTSSEHRKSIEINLWLGLAWICDKHGAFLDLDNEELMNCLDIVSHNVEAHAATADVIRSLLLTHDGGLRPIEYMNKGHMVSALPSAITAVGYSMGQYVASTYVTNEVWFTGLLIGGALATLDLVYLYNAMNPAYRDSTSLSWKLVTVGSPRIGNKEFAKFMSTMPFDVTRIINMGDPVPKLPPSQSAAYQFLNGGHRI
ncbi:hypothetical protein FRB96_009439 [Tulasnella sp. 330]|nr:hypothetical protein FRB96_009439 [Tulasnella sp. 330]